jgi:hypothetical protein
LAGPDQFVLIPVKLQSDAWYVLLEYTQTRS